MSDFHEDLARHQNKPWSRVAWYPESDGFPLLAVVFRVHGIVEKGYLVEKKQHQATSQATWEVETIQALIEGLSDLQSLQTRWESRPASEGN